MEDKTITDQEKETIQSFLLEIKKACKYFKLDLVPTLNVTKQGIIIGGGVSLLNCVKLLDDKKDNWGFEVVKQALVAPIKQIAVNSGFTPELIIEKILLNESETYGMNFLDGEYVDLIKEGIVDPLKVVRAAFQNAISVASVLLTANTTLLLQEDKLDKKL